MQNLIIKVLGEFLCCSSIAHTERAKCQGARRDVERMGARRLWGYGRACRRRGMLTILPVLNNGLTDLKRLGLRNDRLWNGN